MNHKPIIIVPGQPNSIFFEIFFKSLRKKKILSPLILICDLNSFRTNLDKFKLKQNYQSLRTISGLSKISKKFINVIDIKLKKSKKKKIQLNHDNDYITECFDAAFKIIKKKITNKFLNGPINKQKFLNNKYLGITEYLSQHFNKKNTGMLIYNKELSVCPVTTHLPIKIISKKITKKLIVNRLSMINNFFLKNLKKKPKIAVTGLNPHCESYLKINEDKSIIYPAIKFAKNKGILVKGPYSADTIFLKQNRKKFDVVLGMYHDQVLTPLKTLYEYDAINITMGLPFIRVSPDHGPNEKMINKNISNPTSLYKALQFLDQS